MPEVTIQTTSFPEFTEWAEEVDMGTGHLPDAVVLQPVTLCVWASNLLAEDGQPNPNQRRGFFQVGVAIGGRDNPSLTADEKTYLIALLDYAKGIIAAKEEVQSG